MSTPQLVAAALVLGTVTGIVAHHRGGPFGFFFVFGAVLFPIALVVALTARDGRPRCPHCDEVVSAAASVCPHCQREIVRPAATVEAPVVASSLQRRGPSWWR